MNTTRPDIRQLVVLPGRHTDADVREAFERGNPLTGVAEFVLPEGQSQLEFTVVAHWAGAPGNWILTITAEPEGADSVATARADVRRSFGPGDTATVVVQAMSMPVVAPGTVLIRCYCDGKAVAEYHLPVRAA